MKNIKVYAHNKRYIFKFYQIFILKEIWLTPTLHLVDFEEYCEDQ